jgi:hypothetical protein
MEVDRALHGINRAAEVGDDAVAGGVEDAASVRRDQPIDDGTARFQPQASVPTSSRAINRL